MPLRLSGTQLGHAATSVGRSPCLHVVFGEVDVVHAFGLKLQVPVLATLDIASLVLAAGAFVAMLRFHVGMIPVIFVSAALGAGWYLLV